MKQVTFTFCLVMLTALLQAQPFDFETETSGSVGAFTNGWTGSPTTDFRWQADAGGTGSPSTGPAVDHTLGTASGIYLYTEASSPAGTGDVATLTSPALDLTGLSIPGLSFWYHKYGGDMGDLYIEIDDNGTWVVLDSIIGQTQGAETDPWLNYQVNLSGYGSSVTVRFRAVCGPGFTGDMAIDDVDLIDLPAFDASLLSTSVSKSYIQYPVNQVPTDLLLGGTVRNVGGDTLTDVELYVQAGNFLDTVLLGDLLPGAIASGQFSTPFIPPLGTTIPTFSTYSDEADADSTDNVRVGNPIVVNDSVYARDDSSFTGSLGIGAGTAGVLGQNFELVQADTLTSISFFLTAPPQGQQIWVEIYDFNGTPQNVVATSDTLVIPADTGAWYTLRVCPTRLEAGTYFLGVNEVDENITLATNTSNFEPNAGWVIFGTNPWQPSEFYGFTVNYLLRANFGPSIALEIGMDTTVCALDSVPLTVPSNFSNPLWYGSFAADTLSIAAPNFAWVVATGLDGCSYADSITIEVLPSLSAGVDSSLEVCENADTVTLFPLLAGEPAAGGTWIDADTSGALVGGNAILPGLAGIGQYTFTYQVTDTCGYDSMATVTVSILAGPRAGDDTTATLCADAEPVDLSTFLTSSAILGGTWADLDNSGALSGSTFDPVAAGEGTFTLSYVSSSSFCGEDTSTLSLVVETCVGIREAANTWFKLYPNPNQGTFYLSFATQSSSPREVRLVDQMGREVYRALVSGAAHEHQVRTESLPQGVYLLQVRTGERLGQHQVVIR
jgi:hypothetical protein